MPLTLAKLPRLPAFASIDAATRDALMREVRLRDIAPGQHCFAQGEAGDEVVLLVEGCLKLMRTSRAGRTAIVRVAYAGELFGIGPAMGMPRYLLTAVAIRRSRVALWRTADWHRLLGTTPESTDVLRVLGERLDDAYDRLVNNATLDVTARLIHEILQLADQVGRLTEDGTLVDLPLTREDLAAMTGTTLHNVSRILSRLEKQGFVRGGRRRLLVLDVEGLVRLANEQNSAA
jgi:CRP-like cAMP-binding protein